MANITEKHNDHKNQKVTRSVVVRPTMANIDDSNTRFEYKKLIL